MERRSDSGANPRWPAAVRPCVEVSVDDVQELRAAEREADPEQRALLSVLVSRARGVPSDQRVRDPAISAVQTRPGPDGEEIARAAPVMRPALIQKHELRGCAAQLRDVPDRRADRADPRPQT